MGVPAKVVRKLEDSDIAWIKKGVNGYQKLLPEYKKMVTVKD
jgi:carbonic anhydrase/acetyltransferase-like protein (isoleucine patch superfamily)